MIRCLAPVALLAVTALSGCASQSNERPEPTLTPIEVAVPVAIGCVPANMERPPEYPDTDDALRAAADAAVRYQLLWAGRILRAARLAELEPVISDCPKASPK